MNLGWLRGWNGHSLLHGLCLERAMSQVNVDTHGYVATPATKQVKADTKVPNGAIISN